MIKVRNRITGESKVLYINPQYFVLHPDKMIVEKEYLKEHKDVLQQIISKKELSPGYIDKAKTLLEELQVEDDVNLES